MDITRQSNGTATNVRAGIAAQRLALADVLEALTDEQWVAPSLCDSWQVRHVAGHLQVPAVISAPRFTWALLRHRGFHGANRALAIEVGERPRADVLATMRQTAEVVNTPPGTPVEAALADVVVHTIDVLAPLGRSMPVAPEAMLTTLDFVLSAEGKAYRPPGGLAGLRLHAHDLGWRHGDPDHPEVRGAAWDLISVVYGRPARLDHLEGDALAELRARF